MAELYFLMFTLISGFTGESGYAAMREYGLSCQFTTINNQGAACTEVFERGIEAP